MAYRLPQSTFNKTAKPLPAGNGFAVLMYLPVFKTLWYNLFALWFFQQFKELV